MAVDGMRFLVQLRKLAIRTMRASSRSVRNHPVLTGIFLFVILLYRSSPFLFSLLVSASPVLVCTAVLLGTLLSFGNPQIPEIDVDEKISCEVSSLTAGFAPNSTTVYQKEADVDVGGSASMGEVCSVSRFEESLLTPQNSREIVFEQRSVGEEEKDEVKSREVEFSKENVVDDHFEDENFEESSLTFEKGFENEGSDDGNVDDHVESSSVPWTRVNNDHDDDEYEDDDDEDEDYDDSGSDGAESSSPDPSMADIIPLLDELHPLIECESLIPRSQSHEDSGEETDHNSGEDDDEEEEGGDDDVEEEHHGEKEDAEKSAITWTEDDQKNLMDLGSSELERNQRLESLIARRRARKSNLIDLDDLVLPFHITPITTTRQNPFDFPNDTFDNMNLPPIPGSAPSVMLQRRNPFDIPYDSGEEKPDLMDDSFREEFTPNIQKEPVFRRHESFHVGSSFFEFPRQEPRDFQRVSRFKPYFIPERLASESGSSYMRQSSEASDESSFHLSFKRQLSDMSESKASSTTEIELVSAEIDREKTKVDDHDSIGERTLDPEIDHGSEHVEHGSQSSEYFDDQIEKSDFDLHMPEIILGESESHVGAEISLGSSGNDRDVDSWVSEARDLAAITGIIEADMDLNASVVEDKHDDVKEANEGSVLMENSDVQSENLFNTSDFHHHERSVFDSNITLETIEEEHIISPSSSLTSEECNITEGLKPNEALMNVHSNNNPDSPTEMVVDSLNMDLGGSRIEDPVYDLSPQASRIDLSVSCEELADLENRELKLEGDCLLHESVGEDDAKLDQEDQFMSENSNAQAEFFSTANVSTEEPVLVSENAKAVDVSDTVDEQLISVAEEGESAEDHCLISSPPFHYEEEPFVVPEKLQEVISENREMDDLLSLPSQTVETSTTVQELTHEHVTDFIDFSDPEEGRVNFEFESSIVEDADEQSPLPDPFVPQTLDEALLSELDVVGDFHVAESGMAFEAENTEAGINEVQDSHMSEDNIQYEPLEDESVEHIEKSSDDNTLEPSSDVFFMNEIQPEVQNAEVGMGEFEYSQVIENEPIENVESSASEVLFINAYKLKEEDPDTGLAELVESHVLESMTMSHVPESESIQSDEIFGTIESVKLQDEFLLDRTEVDPREGLKLTNKADEMMTNYCDTSELQKETVVETTESISANEEEIERYNDAAIDTLIEKDEPAAEIIESVHAVEQEIEPAAEIIEYVHTVEQEIEPAAEIIESVHTVEQEIEPAAEIIESVHAVEQEIEPAAEIIESAHTVEQEIEPAAETIESAQEKEIEPAAETIESAHAVEQEIEPAVEWIESVHTAEHEVEPAEENINEFVHVMEEEIERSRGVDFTLDSHVLGSGTSVEKGESAEEINEFVHVVEEEIERSDIDASFDSDDLNDDLIEKDELTGAETNEIVPDMKEESEWSAIDAFPDSSDSMIDAQIEKDEEPALESNELVSAMEEEVEKYSIDASSDSDVLKDDAQIDSVPAIEEEIISRDAPLDSQESLIEKAETNDLIPAMEEKIEGSVSANAESDTSSGTQIDEQLAPESNESVSAMEEEIERSFIDSFSIENAEADDSTPDTEEEVEGSSADNAAAIDTQIEKDEQPDAETYESVPAMEEENKVSSIDAVTDSQFSENNDLVENAESNESALSMEQERVFDNSFSDSNLLTSDTQVEKDEQLAAESNKSVPSMEEEIERSFIDTFSTESAEADESNPAIDASTDHFSENFSQIQSNDLVPAMENTIDAFSDPQVSENNSLNPQPGNTETNESVLVLEEEKEFANAGVDAPLDSYFSKSNTQVQIDELVPTVEDVIDAFLDSEPSENDVLNHLENTETNESSLVTEDEKDFVNADTSDSHVLNSETLIEKDALALGGECQDAEEMENNQDKSFPESEQPTPAQDPTNLQLESPQTQALQEEDHQKSQTQLSVDHLNISTEIASVTEETPKREEE